MDLSKVFDQFHGSNNFLSIETCILEIYYLIKLCNYINRHNQHKQDWGQMQANVGSIQLSYTGGSEGPGYLRVIYQPQCSSGHSHEVITVVQFSCFTGGMVSVNYSSRTVSWNPMFYIFFLSEILLQYPTSSFSYLTVS